MRAYQVNAGHPQLAKLDALTFPTDWRFSFDGNLCWLAEADDGQVAGFATLELFPGFAYLSRAGVLGKYRRQGIHKRLTEVRIKRARAEGKPRVVTYTADHNIASANGLIARGFRLYKPPAYWGAPGDGYLYFERLT